MAQKFLTSIDLGKNELLNARIQVLATAPASPVEGQIYFNSTDDILYYYTGTAWVAASGDITAVVAGSGLSGGGTSGSVTLTNADKGSDQMIYKHVSDGVGGIIDAESNDDTLVISAGTGITTAAIPGTGLTITAENIPNSSLQNSSVTYTAGTGLTGGGAVSLGGTATINVGAGTGIAVSADAVALKNAGSLTANAVTKWDAVNGQLVNSSISDDGTNVTIAANLIVNGTTTSVNSNEVNIGDAIIKLNADETGAPSQNAGFEVWRGTEDSVSFIWDETNDRFSTIDQPLHIGSIATGGNTARILVEESGVVKSTTPASIVNDGLSLTNAGNVTITDAGNGQWSLAVADASTTTKGVVELATNTETTTGTATTLATTPAGVKAAIDYRLSLFSFYASFRVGDGVQTTFTLTHAQNRDVIVQIYDTGTGQYVFTDVTRIDSNNIEVTFNEAPAFEQYKVLVQGVI